MTTQQAYDLWAPSYDLMTNRTRDADALAVRSAFTGKRYDHVLEAGCGTGKNTGFLASTANKVTAADFSVEMLAKARAKDIPGNVSFVHADLTKEWQFECSEAVVCSLVAEHFKDLTQFFKDAFNALVPGGVLFISEVHPYRLLNLTNIEFEVDGVTIAPQIHRHHLSDYVQAGLSSGFRLDTLQEIFDDDERRLPVIFTFLFSRPSS